MIIFSQNKRRSNVEKPAVSQATLLLQKKEQIAVEQRVFDAKKRVVMERTAKCEQLERELEVKVRDSFANIADSAISGKPTKSKKQNLNILLAIMRKSKVEYLPEQKKMQQNRKQWYIRARTLLFNTFSKQASMKKTLS